MKLYKQPDPPTLMRINIRKQGSNTEHIAIEDAEQQATGEVDLQLQRAAELLKSWSIFQGSQKKAQVK